MKNIQQIAFLLMGIVLSNNYFGQEGDSQFYIDKDGKKQDYAFHDCYPKQEGKLYCIECIDDVSYEEKIMFEERYRSISETEYNGFFKAQGDNKLFGLINYKGDIILDFIYTDFGYPDLSDGNYEYNQEKIFSVFTKKGQGLYSLQRGELMPPIYDYFEEDYDFMYSIYGNLRIRKGKNIGYYSLKSKKETIPPIYKEIDHGTNFEWNSDSLIVKNAKGKYGIISQFGEVILPVEYDEINYYFGDYAMLANIYTLFEVKKSKFLGIYAPNRNKWIVPCKFTEVKDYKDFDEGELGAYIVKNKKKVGVIDFYGNELLPAIFDEINVSSSRLDFFTELDTVVVYGSIDDKYFANVNFALKNINPPKYDSIGFDLIAGFYGYRFKDVKEKVNLLTGELTKVDETLIEGEMYDIFRQDEKFGAKNKNGEILIEAIYEKAHFLNGRTEVMIGYESGEKYYIYVESGKRYTEQEW